MTPESIVVIYGISNCDTVRKAKKWLEQHNIPYEFQDFRKDGLNPILLRKWVEDLGFEALVNKRSTTWRNLPQETKDNFNELLAIAVMEDQPTLIKRPILEFEDQRLVGFSDKTYSTAFNL